MNDWLSLIFVFCCMAVVAAWHKDELAPLWKATVDLIAASWELLKFWLRLQQLASQQIIPPGPCGGIEPYRPGNTDAERCLCQECQQRKGLKVVDRLIYRIGQDSPVGYFDEMGMYQSYEHLPQYEEMLVSYPDMEESS